MTRTARNISSRCLTALFSQFKVLMEHLDRDEEDEEGEASANARNKAITSLLKGSKPSNHNHSNHTAPVETDEEDSEEEDPPAVRILKSLAHINSSIHLPNRFIYTLFYS